MNWLLVPGAYLLGSVSFAWLAGRAKGIDLRRAGSGNLGATNAGRVLGKGWFLAVFIADLLKGLVPVMIAKDLAAHHGASGSLPIAVGAAAIIGHVFTCFFAFKGGKAVATSLGVLTGLLLDVAAISLGIWILAWTVSYLLLRKSSDAVGPASVIAAAAMPFVYLARYPDPWSLLAIPMTLFLFVLSALVVVKHRSNIAKLLRRRDPLG